MWPAVMEAVYRTASRFPDNRTGLYLQSYINVQKTLNID